MFFGEFFVYRYTFQLVETLWFSFWNMFFIGIQNKTFFKHVRLLSWSVIAPSSCLWLFTITSSHEKDKHLHILKTFSAVSGKWLQSVSKASIWCTLFFNRCWFEERKTKTGVLDVKFWSKQAKFTQPPEWLSLLVLTDQSRQTHFWQRKFKKLF